MWPFIYTAKDLKRLKMLAMPTAPASEHALLHEKTLRETRE
jgi:hypothetical protein